VTVQPGNLEPRRDAGEGRDDGRVRVLRRQEARSGARPQWRPIPAWSWMLGAVIAVAVTAFVITTWLLAIASHAKPGTDQANARLDAVRTGLAAGGGAGAAVGLMLAFRRQHHQEISTALTDYDAAQRRITELYSKSVEQLGSDKAPVRLGGLYALERLAQDNPDQRQTMVDVICAYLRMPFPAQAPGRTAAPSERERRRRPGGPSQATSYVADDEWEQEKQVRLTAQRVLANHVRRPGKGQGQADASPERFWDNLRLDLTDATLIDFNLTDGTVADALFGGATFSGDARFDGATFSGDARFDRATFSGGGARFNRATFSGDARFDRATFSGGGARFDRATFSGVAWFGGATFSGDARFDRATFNSARFDRATFSGDARFDRATFNSARFDKATFSGDARFDKATFSGVALFDKATFSGVALFDGATFNGDVEFGGATFERRSNSISLAGVLIRSSDNNHVWPEGWQPQDNGTGGLTVVRANGTTSL
jgi:uncharacterized protein YjbI with pentapeptide repeats